MECIYDYQEYSPYIKMCIRDRLFSDELGNLKYRERRKNEKDFIHDASEFILDKGLRYKYYDESRIIDIDGCEYEILPFGLKNLIADSFFLSEVKMDRLRAFDLQLARTLKNTINPTWRLFYYDNYGNKTSFINRGLNFEDKRWNKLTDSYISYYNYSLNEKWSTDTFMEMIKNLEYLSVQYVRCIDTGEVFPVGFFGTYIRNGADGKCFTNAELYVLPEFRKMGIAKKLVTSSFEMGLQDNINTFDSITYKIKDMNALSFWMGIDAKVSGLTHIEGDISLMLKKIYKGYSLKK